MGLQLELEGFSDGARVPPDFAVGVPAADEPMELGPNRNPGLSWAALWVSGLNDYTGFLAANPDMAGTYGGYDGPCPPWNDERLHHYRFTLFALDVESLGLSGEFTGPDAAAAMKGHILDSVDVTGSYTLNPEVA